METEVEFDLASRAIKSGEQSFGEDCEPDATGIDVRNIQGI